MVGMKASVKAAGLATKKPLPRQATPDIDVQELKSLLHAYTEKLGCKESFQLYAYNNLHVSKAVDGSSLKKKTSLLWCLLKVAPLGAIKYSQLKEVAKFVMDSFGEEVFHTFKQHGSEYIVGKVADELFVMLAHVRRVLGSQDRWAETFGKMEDLDDFEYMQEHMVAAGFVVKEKSGAASSAAPSVVETPVTPKATRQIKKHNSDITVDSDGLPTIPQTKVLKKVLSTPVKSPSLATDICMESPPPLKKRPASAAPALKDPPAPGPAPKKKPAASSSSCKVTGDFKVIKTTMKVSGGKHQSYIQHVPSGTKNKQLVVAVSGKMVDGKKQGHKQVADALLKWALSKPVVTKMEVVKQRDIMLKSL
jgi:hypothetical protein